MLLTNEANRRPNLISLIGKNPEPNLAFTWDRYVHALQASQYLPEDLRGWQRTTLTKIGSEVGTIMPYGVHFECGTENISVQEDMDSAAAVLIKRTSVTQAKNVSDSPLLMQPGLTIDGTLTYPAKISETVVLVADFDGLKPRKIEKQWHVIGFNESSSSVVVKVEDEGQELRNRNNAENYRVVTRIGNAKAWAKVSPISRIGHGGGVFQYAESPSMVTGLDATPWGAFSEDDIFRRLFQDPNYIKKAWINSSKENTALQNHLMKILEVLGGFNRTLTSPPSYDEVRDIMYWNTIQKLSAPLSI